MNSLNPEYVLKHPSFGPKSVSGVNVKSMNAHSSFGKINKSAELDSDDDFRHESDFLKDNLKGN